MGVLLQQVDQVASRGQGGMRVQRLLQAVWSRKRRQRPAWANSEQLPQLQKAVQVDGQRWRQEKMKLQRQRQVKME